MDTDNVDDIDDKPDAAPHRGPTEAQKAYSRRKKKAQQQRKKQQLRALKLGQPSPVEDPVDEEEDEETKLAKLYEACLRRQLGHKTFEASAVELWLKEQDIPRSQRVHEGVASGPWFASALMRYEMGDEMFESSAVEHLIRASKHNISPLVSEADLRRDMGDNKFEVAVRAIRMRWQQAWTRMAATYAKRADAMVAQHDLKAAREDDVQTAKNQESSRQQAQVRARAEAAKANRVERPFTAPGPSHRAKPVKLVAATPSFEQRAKEAIRRAQSHQAVAANQQAQDDKEALRVAQREAQLEARRIALCIARGD